MRTKATNTRIGQPHATSLAALLLFLAAAAVAVADSGCRSRASADENEAHEGESEHQKGSRKLKLPAKVLEEFGVTFEIAKPGLLEEYLNLPGEVVLDPARVVHVVPRVSGVVRQVLVRQGDVVRRGQLLATISSERLAELGAEYIGARAEAALAREEFEREKRLYEKGASSQREFARARRDLRKAYIRVEAAKSRLMALGLTKRDVRRLASRSASRLSHYELRSPMDGVLVHMHITRGERVGTDKHVFTIADTRKVWVELKVYGKDLDRVHPGQKVLVTSAHGTLAAEAVIDYVTPIVLRDTRTARARAVLDNPEGRWRPGLFVTGKVVVASAKVPVLVPREAVQRVDEKPCVFVDTGDGLVCKPVHLGRDNGRFVEVRFGLNPGTRYVAKGGFVLKSELSKEGFAEGHEH